MFVIKCLREYESKCETVSASEPGDPGVFVVKKKTTKSRKCCNTVPLKEHFFISCVVTLSLAYRCRDVASTLTGNPIWYGINLLLSTICIVRNRLVYNKNPYIEHTKYEIRTVEALT
jgi:hypothetical protein